MQAEISKCFAMFWSITSFGKQAIETPPQALNVPFSHRKNGQEKAMNLTPSAQTRFMCDLARTERHCRCMSLFVA